jgi:cephalosporin-C deacetylase
MPWFDLPLDQLRDYRTDTAEPPELDAWWRRRLDEARAAAREPTLTRYQAGTYAPVEVYDTEFSGAGGDRIRAWYLRPAGADAARTVVKFIGYGGGRGLPTEHALLPALGYTLFVMDTRGQGGQWTTGATADQAAGPGSGPENASVMTRGIGRPEDYYYTRLFTDAVRAVETARELTGAARVAVSGISQGGGLALAAAGLAAELVSVCHADVPFLCDIQRAITLAPQEQLG